MPDLTCLCRLIGVEHAPNLDSLRDAIQKVQEASISLDLLKQEVGSRLLSLLERPVDQSLFDQCIDQYSTSNVSRECISGQQTAPQTPFSGESPGGLKCEFAQVLEQIWSINKRLSRFEQGFLHNDGIPERTW